jgi:hypothetical protein
MLRSKMTLWLRREIDLLKLRRRHLSEKIALRYKGLRYGTAIWETTIELGLKLVSYVCLTCLWWLLGIWVDMYLSSIGVETRWDD